MANTIEAKAYLAIIFICGGSGWGTGKTLREALDNCKRITERDWGTVVIFDEIRPSTAHVFALESPGQPWSCGVDGMFIGESREPAKPIKKHPIYLKNREKRRA